MPLLTSTYFLIYMYPFYLISTLKHNTKFVYCLLNNIKAPMEGNLNFEDGRREEGGEVQSLRDHERQSSILNLNAIQSDKNVHFS